MRTFILAALLLCLGMGHSAYCHLSEEVQEAIEEQRLEIDETLRTLNDVQRELTVQRYVDLIMASPLNDNLDIKRSELLAFVTKVIKSVKHVADAVPNIVQKKTVFSAQVIQDLKKLQDKLKTTLRDDELTVSLACRKAFYDIPFLLKEDENFNELKMTLNGIRIPEGDSVVSPDKRCLEFKVKSSNRTAELEWLGTKNAACPIPGEKGGNCLLDFAEQIMKALELESVTLLDVSHLVCSKNKKEADLRRLKIFQKGQSWYEKNEYVPTPEIENYKDKLKAFRNYSLETFRGDVDDQKFTDESKLLRRMTKKFTKTKLEPTLAAFMSWLWDKDCAAYIVIDALIANEASGLKVQKLYPFTGSFFKNLKVPKSP